MEKFSYIKEAIYIHNPNIESTFCEIQKKYNLSLETFIEVISRKQYNLKKDLGLSATSISIILKILFPNRDSGNKPCTYLLSMFDCKFCTKCEQVKFAEDFSRNTAIVGGLNTYCKLCHVKTSGTTQRGRQSKYRAAILNRTPSWADLDKIKQFYLLCPENHDVDHVIPLQGELVSGLHVLSNLQYLPSKENNSKSNKFTIE